jgi:hypothetical protein
VEEVPFTGLSHPLPWDRWPWLAQPQARAHRWRLDGADPGAALDREDAEEGTRQRGLSGP